MTPAGPLFRDRAGKPLTIAEADALLSDAEYVTVAATLVVSAEFPSNKCVVSTVWLGNDLGLLFGSGPPILFETMVFSDGHPMDRQCWRYATEAQAQAGHADVVAAIVATVPHAVLADLPPPAAPPPP